MYNMMLKEKPAEQPKLLTPEELKRLTDPDGLCQTHDEFMNLLEESGKTLGRSNNE